MPRRIIVIVLPLFIFSIVWALLYQSPLSLFDLKDLQTATFADEKRDNGQSEIISFKEDPHFKAIQFELKEAFISPYAGMSFFQENTYWDLSPYNEVEIEVELQNTKNLELTLATYQNGVTKENEPLSFRHNVMEIPILENVTVCRLPFEKVQIAQWWLEKFKLRSTELGPEDFSKTASVSFVAKIRLDNAKPQLLKINKILFKRNLTVFYCISIPLLLFLYAGIGFYYKRPNKGHSPLKKKQETPHGESNEKIMEEDKMLLEHLANHYMDPDLTLGKMSEILKVPEKTISGSIKKNFNMSFKEYLNSIRLSEAKRLLKMSDKNVSEVAYEVGFSSPNHFNRTFKNQEGCTPTEFRTQQA
jgi:AraC-like DNA-binding protein